MNAFRLGIICLTTFLVGCAAGNTYDYGHANVNLAARGNSDLGLAVIDQRPYVLSGDKKPSFVGLQRGGFGNPFKVSTKSGRALADEMAAALISELKDNGFKAVNLRISKPDSKIIAGTIRDAAMARNIILTVQEWRTDGFFSFELSYDLRLSILDESANLIAEAETFGSDEKIGGSGFEDANSIAAANAFSSKIGQLFNDPDIMSALNDLQ